MTFQFTAESIFEIGIEIEKNGKIFYQEVAKSVSDDRLRALFQKLADWEDQHVELFRTLLDNVPESMRQDDLFDPDDEMLSYLKAAADSHVFVATSDVAALVGTQCKTPAQALDLALDFEKDSVVYYTTMKKVVAKHMGQEKIDLLIEEELKHIRILNEKKTQFS